MSRDTSSRTCSLWSKATSALVAPALIAVVSACGGDGSELPESYAAGASSGTGAEAGAPGGGGNSGSAGSAGTIGSGGAPPALGEPIQVDSTEQWVWVPIPGTVCADGTMAGVGVNFTTQSRELVIWFQGNGVCYNLTSCTLFQSLLVGMGPDPLDHMWWGDKLTGHIGIFDRADATNPFRKSNFIVFPHCGVDGHTADKESTYPPLKTVQQRGYANVTVALQNIVPTFVDATRIVVAGFSAGGIGAGANYHQIATAFEAVGQPSPFLIDDGGPVLRPPYLGPVGQSALRAGWGLDKTIEPWCPKCATEGYHAVMETVAELHPGVRTALISSYADDVATPLYGLLNADLLFTGVKFEAGLHDLSASRAAAADTISPSVERMFFYPGTRHGALAVAALSATPGLAAFLDAQLGGDPTWATVEP
jgi:hypothetical protein